MMRILAFIAGGMVIAQASAQPAAPAAQSKPATAPRIIFQNPAQDFGRISSGVELVHTFYFTNVGTAPLVLASVQPSCGCTTAGEWTRQVPPGGTGQIPVKFSTAGFNGPVIKTVNISCNDPQQQVVHLQLKATVWKPIDVTPTYAVLNVMPDSTGATATVWITNNLEFPVGVWDPRVSNPAFAVTLNTNVDGKAYQATVSVSPPMKPGNMQGLITFKTSATNSPEVKLNAWANVQPAVSIIPQNVNLPQAPLVNPLTPIVTIINNTTNPLVLTKAELSVPGASVELTEVQPGRYFTARLKFPAGFEAPVGQPVAFTVESNNPKFAKIRVPVYQMRRPAQVQQASPPLAPPAAPSGPQPSAAPAIPSGFPGAAPAATITPQPTAKPVTGVRHVLPRRAATAAGTPPPPMPSPGTTTAASR